MTRGHEASQPRGDLDAGHEGGETGAARSALGLTEGEDCRVDRRRRVSQHGLEDVVVVEGVRGRPVRHGGLIGADPRRTADDRGLRMGALIQHFGGQDGRHRFATSGQTHPQPVDETLFGQQDDIGGQVLVAQIAVPFRECLGRPRIRKRVGWSCHVGGGDAGGSRPAPRRLGGGSRS